MAVPIIAWMGGKRRLAKTLLPLFPQHTCYVEPFSGAAALFFMKEPSKAEVLNDVNGDIINLFRVIQNHPEEFVNQFKWALSSRQVFKWLKDTPIDTLTDIQRASRFYYLQKLCFGARHQNPSFGTSATTPPRLNLLRLEDDISQAHLRLSRALIENEDWLSCCKRYDREGTLFYLDPPYYELTGYGVEFDFNQYQQIAQFASSCKGKVLISLNDHPDLVDLFKDFTLERTNIKYTTAGPNRSGKSSSELIIRNY